MCERKCLTDLIPMTLVFVSLFWSYYVFIYEICFSLVESKFVFMCYMIVYHFLLIIMMVMYFVCMFHRGYVVPEKYLIPLELLDELQRNKGNDEVKYLMLVDFCKKKQLVVYTRVPHNGGIRYCVTCGIVKPDRTHHCNTCNRCILKMDHHCAWVNNCIGFTNYKFFMILVFYSAVYCLFYFAASLYYTIQFLLHWDHLRQLSIVLNTFATFVLFVILFALLFFHLKLIMNNDTILEVMYRPTFFEPHCTFDAGWRENFYNHCTWNPLQWCVPINTMSGTGADFEVYRD